MAVGWGYQRASRSKNDRLIVSRLGINERRKQLSGRRRQGGRLGWPRTGPRVRAGRAISNVQTRTDCWQLQLTRSSYFGPAARRRLLLCSARDVQRVDHDSSGAPNRDCRATSRPVTSYSHDLC